MPCESGEESGILNNEQCLYSDLVSGPKETPEKDVCLFYVSELGEAKNSDKILSCQQWIWGNEHLLSTSSGSLFCFSDFNFLAFI